MIILSRIQTIAGKKFREFRVLEKIIHKKKTKYLYDSHLIFDRFAKF